MTFKFFKAAIASVILSVSGLANAGIITVEGVNVDSGNCIPFGCAGSYGPFMTNVYKDISAFSLNSGDTISFDLSGVNDVDIIFDIFLASTTINGGITADVDGFTQVVFNGNGGKGTAIQGDYELLYTIGNSWDFSGGGLMIAFSPKGVTATDTTWSTGFYGNNNASGKHVGQFYNGASAGAGTYRTSEIPNFQLTINEQVSVPEPSTLTMFALCMIGLASRRYKKHS